MRSQSALQSGGGGGGGGGGNSNIGREKERGGWGGRKSRRSQNQQEPPNILGQCSLDRCPRLRSIPVAVAVIIVATLAMNRECGAAPWTTANVRPSALLGNRVIIVNEEHDVFLRLVRRVFSEHGCDMSIIASTPIINVIYNRWINFRVATTSQFIYMYFVCVRARARARVCVCVCVIHIQTMFQSTNLNTHRINFRYQEHTWPRVQCARINAYVKFCRYVLYVFLPLRKCVSAAVSLISEFKRDRYRSFSSCIKGET